MELKIQTYIKKHGLQQAIDFFKLKVNHYPHKVILKYDQINSSYEYDEVRECRGLILEKNTWEIMSMAFTKFFNKEEGYAAKIDWKNSIVFDKLDGSLISLYWDWVKQSWEVATTGMAEAEGDINGGITTFRELFWNTILQYDGHFNGLKIAERLFDDDLYIKNINVDKDYSIVYNHENFNLELNQFLTKKYTYVFELTTPRNIIVTPHTEYNTTLLTVRDLKTLKELHIEDLHLLGHLLGIPVVKSVGFSEINYLNITKTFENMPFSQEGYVVRDNKDRRVKIKNPAYVAAHHLKGSLAEYRIMSIIKSNELDEFIATFPDRRNELLLLNQKYAELQTKLISIHNILLQYYPADITAKSNKNYATKVFEICKQYDVVKFTGLYFGLKDKKIESVQKYLSNMDDKRLYYLLIDKKDG